MTCGYRRKPSVIRTLSPTWGIQEVRPGEFAVRPWVPGTGTVYIGYRRSLREAQQLRDEFLREKGLK